MLGHVVSVNAGRTRTVEWQGRQVTTAIHKEPVAGRVTLRGVNVEGDEQANREVHGGRDQALYAYAAEDAEWWAQQLGRPLAPGTFGENLTTRGVDVNGARIGERWRVGTAVVEVRAPRIPCAKLGMRMGDPAFPRRFAAAHRPGAYLAIDTAGELAAGDPVTLVDRPHHDVTVAMVARAYHGERGLSALLLTATQLPDDWRSWAEKVIAHRSA
jgi:MOSC domain-containing protein YiiM